MQDVPSVGITVEGGVCSNACWLVAGVKGSRCYQQAAAVNTGLKIVTLIQLRAALLQVTGVCLHEKSAAFSIKSTILIRVTYKVTGACKMTF